MFLRFAIVAVVLGAVGCTNTDSYTNLYTDGPPRVAQARMKESYTDATNAVLARRVFGYGTQPMATSDDEHPVTSASATGQAFRLIMTELLVGNALEEVQCRAAVQNDPDLAQFDIVPDGATPDDIAKCSVSDDALAESCTGAHAVCVCHLPQGCLSGTTTIAMGQPVGVLDVNQDGAADNTSFRRGAVEIHCGAINVPVDLDMSYWNPSGDQQVPAMGGFDALGPAIVLTPKGGIMPTNITCGFVFANNVVDKSTPGNQVCAPAAGRPPECDQWPPLYATNPSACIAKLACNPGDMSALTWKTEPLTVKVQGIADGDTGVDPTAPIFANANAPVDAASLVNTTITPPVAGGLTVTAVMPTQIKVVATGGTLAAATHYTLTFPTTVTDTFGQGLPADTSISFTTM